MLLIKKRKNLLLLSLLLFFCCAHFSYAHSSQGGYINEVSISPFVASQYWYGVYGQINITTTGTAILPTFISTPGNITELNFNLSLECTPTHLEGYVLFVNNTLIDNISTGNLTLLDTLVSNPENASATFNFTDTLELFQQEYNNTPSLELNYTQSNISLTTLEHYLNSNSTDLLFASEIIQVPELNDAYIYQAILPVLTMPSSYNIFVYLDYTCPPNNPSPGGSGGGGGGSSDPDPIINETNQTDPDPDPIYYEDIGNTSSFFMQVPIELQILNQHAVLFPVRFNENPPEHSVIRINTSSCILPVQDIYTQSFVHIGTHVVTNPPLAPQINCNISKVVPLHHHTPLSYVNLTQFSLFAPDLISIVTLEIDKIIYDIKNLLISNKIIYPRYDIHQYNRTIQGYLQFSPSNTFSKEVEFNIFKANTTSSLFVDHQTIPSTDPLYYFSYTLGDQYLSGNYTIHIDIQNNGKLYKRIERQIVI